MERLVTFILCAVLLMSCGESRRAKSTVRAFLKENMKTEDYHADLFNLDSTYRVSDSAIYSMRQTADMLGVYKGGIRFAERDRSGKLVFIQAKIITGKDTLRQTFYMNPDLKEVVAVKEN